MQGRWLNYYSTSSAPPPLEAVIVGVDDDNGDLLDDGGGGLHMSQSMAMEIPGLDARRRRDSSNGLHARRRRNGLDTMARRARCSTAVAGSLHDSGATQTAGMDGLPGNSAGITGRQNVTATEAPRRNGRYNTPDKPTRVPITIAHSGAMHARTLSPQSPPLHALASGAF
uniref:Uncharacterized protein n=1 Tax=Oryza glumipatula TaxID=40148 RepID=A0A0D9YF30_9ORYZ